MKCSKKITQIKNRHFSYYGNIKLERMYCEKCKNMTIIQDDIKLCCGKEIYADIVDKPEYICAPLRRRRPLSKKNRYKLLDMQNNRCIYCGIRFNSVYMYKEKKRIAKIEYDHFSPFIFGYDNRPSNYVACCKMCNSIKSSKIFKTFEEAQEHILHKRETKGLPSYI